MKNKLSCGICKKTKKRVVGYYFSNGINHFIIEQKNIINKSKIVSSKEKKTKTGFIINDIFEYSTPKIKGFTEIERIIY